MSKRRKPLEIVKRQPGSGFLGNVEPFFVQIPGGKEYTSEAEPCILNCDDVECREWANLEIVTDSGQKTGDFLYHISECQMSDC